MQKSSVDKTIEPLQSLDKMSNELFLKSSTIIECTSILQNKSKNLDQLVNSIQ